MDSHKRHFDVGRRIKGSWVIIATAAAPLPNPEISNQGNSSNLQCQTARAGVCVCGSGNPRSHVGTNPTDTPGKRAFPQSYEVAKKNCCLLCCLEDTTRHRILVLDADPWRSYAFSLHLTSFGCTSASLLSFSCCFQQEVQFTELSNKDLVRPQSLLLHVHACMRVCMLRCMRAGVCACACMLTYVPPCGQAAVCAAELHACYPACSAMPSVLCCCACMLLCVHA